MRRSHITSVALAIGLVLPSIVASASAASPPSSASTPASYHVTIDGAFPPRAERYAVTADGRFVGYGTPTFDESGLEVVSDDPALLTGTLEVSPGGERIDDAIADAARASSSSPRPQALAPEPSGPLAVTKTQYDFGEQVFQPTEVSGKVELTADVHYPTGLAGGPYPLVVFMHGNHSACFQGGDAGYDWPCPAGWDPLPNYEGYDYLAEDLASYGYIVASVSANGVNVLGNEVDDTGMRQRGEVIEAHLDLWNDWNATGGAPFGTMFMGKVDMTKIGVMGHSRGGEGAVYSVIVDRERPSPYGIDAVLALAPVDFTRPPINDVPFAVMLPYCDGDVSDLQGIHFFDDSRYEEPGDTTPKHTVTVFGANHNFFNTVWTPSFGYPGGFDDTWTPCEGTLGAAGQRAVGVAYIGGFFRRYLGDETALDPIWTGETLPPGIGTATPATTYFPGTSDRLDIDRFRQRSDMTTNQQGGAVTKKGVSVKRWCPDTETRPCILGGNAYNDIHLSASWFVAGLPGLQQGVFGWDTSGTKLRFILPDAEDVSAYDAIQVRAAQNQGYAALNRRIKRQDFSMVLIDGSAAISSVAASEVGDDALLHSAPNLGRYRMILSQVRFPLSEFTGVDLTDIKTVEIRFDRKAKGALSLSDLAFVSGSA